MSDGEQDGVPESPLTVLAAGAAQTHELFEAYVEAGFTRAEALQIVISLLTASLT